MKLYELYCKPDIDGNSRSIWSIHENETSLVILATSDETRARRISKILNRGGGFGGCTPAFFGQLKDVLPSY